MAKRYPLNLSGAIYFPDVQEYIVSAVAAGIWRDSRVWRDSTGNADTLLVD